jgi:hypothetical protein
MGWASETRPLFSNPIGPGPPKLAPYMDEEPPVNMVALNPDFWIFFSSLVTHICCSSVVGAIRSISLAVVGS